MRVAIGGAALVAAVVAGVAGFAASRQADRAAGSGAFGTDAALEAAGADAAWATWEGVAVSAQAFPGEPWARDLLAGEMNVAVPDETLGWANGDVALPGVTVRDGRRMTVQTYDPDHTIWLFGGSTIYGFGQRDQGTIASQMVLAARRAGVRLRVVNFGVPAYVLAQESTLFELLLETWAPPDAAIFVDGVNEVGAAFEREIYGLFDPDEDVVLAATRTLQDERRADAASRQHVFRYDPARHTRLAAAQYRRGATRVDELGRRAGVEVLRVWQPCLATIPPDRPNVAEVLHNVGASLEDQASAGEISHRILTASGVDAIDLTRMFDRVDHPVFFDWSHSNEAGARDQAELIVEHTLPLLSA